MSDNIRLLIQSPPFVRGRFSSQGLMIAVVLALLPAAVASVYFFGQSALIHIVATVVTAVAVEGLSQIVAGRRITILDGSAALTGLLLAFNLPPAAPYWIGPAGAAIAILVVKQLFGGLGHNFVNPALAARVILLASWPKQMVSFVSPIDALSTATPLAIIQGGEAVGTWPSMFDMFIGRIGGSLGETSALALMLGGIALIYFGIIDYRIPAGILGTIFVMGTLFGGAGINPSYGLYHVLAGGAILGAFFMATDYVTSPVTKRGRWIYGMSIGFIAMLIRLWGSFPEGVSYAILLMNIGSPLIERFTIPRKFGEVSTNARSTT